eukprot:GHVO01017004.1.p1 GENE.GHVO01017004.1~~GHVO01017004.1.p1  ORF type:complete len:826 (-),score=190.92 GHVO01017004.1:227-2704(-)
MFQWTAPPQFDPISSTHDSVPQEREVTETNTVLPPRETVFSPNESTRRNDARESMKEVAQVVLRPQKPREPGLRHVPEHQSVQATETHPTESVPTRSHHSREQETFLNRPFPTVSSQRSRRSAKWGEADVIAPRTSSFPEVDWPDRISVVPSIPPPHEHQQQVPNPSLGTDADADAPPKKKTRKKTKRKKTPDAHVRGTLDFGPPKSDEFSSFPPLPDPPKDSLPQKSMESRESFDPFKSSTVQEWPDPPLITTVPYEPSEQKKRNEFQFYKTDDDLGEPIPPSPLTVSPSLDNSVAPKRPGSVRSSAPDPPPTPSATTDHLVAQIQALKSLLKSAETSLRPRIEMELKAEIDKKIEEQKRQSEKTERELEDLKNQMEHTSYNVRDAEQTASRLREEIERHKRECHERETAVGHAKSMWLKESCRASALGDQLEEAEKYISDQEANLDALNEHIHTLKRQGECLKRVLDIETFGRDPLIMSNDDIRQITDEPLPTTHHRSETLKPTPSKREMDPIRFSSPPTVPHPRTLTGRYQGGGGGSTLPSASGLDDDIHAYETSRPRIPDAPQSQEQIDNIDKFRDLILINDAVLYEDDTLQIGIKASYTNLTGMIEIYFGNLRHFQLDGFTVSYTIDDSDALGLNPEPYPNIIYPQEQIKQSLAVSCSAPYIGTPRMRLQFLLPDASPRSIIVALPIPVTKFMNGRDMRPSEIVSLWGNEHFMMKETSSIINLSDDLTAAFVHVAKHLQLGGALMIHHGVDSRPENLVAVGGFPPSSVDPAIPLSIAIVRLELGAGKYRNRVRITIRSDSSTLSQSLRAVYGTQLGRGRK